MFGDLANYVRKKIVSEDFEPVLLPALVHVLTGGLSRASSGVLQVGWPWAGWIIVPKEDFAAKVSY